MNNERINNLLTIAKRLDTETKNRSITISTEEMIDLLEISVKLTPLGVRYKLQFNY